MAKKPQHKPHPSPMKRGGGKPKVQPGGTIKRARQHGGHKPPAVQPGGPVKRGGGGKPKVQPGGTIKRAKKHPKRHLAGTPLGGWWITGGNDQLDNCAAVAVANSLLFSSGLRVSDGELARLWDRAGPLSIPEALAAFRPVSFTELYERFTELHVIAGLVTPHGPHAALWLPGGLVTWGALIEWPDDWLAEEAWEVRW